MAEFVWTPTPEQVERANVTRLIRRLGCADYHELQRLSIAGGAFRNRAIRILRPSIQSESAARIVDHYGAPRKEAFSQDPVQGSAELLRQAGHIERDCFDPIDFEPANLQVAQLQVDLPRREQLTSPA